MAAPTKVLLIGDTMRGAHRLQRHLEQKRCQLRWVKSVDRAISCDVLQSVDLVLCGANLGVSRLVEAAKKSSVYLLCFLQVEDGGWWLPAVRNGDNCLGSAAIGSTKFQAFLDLVLLEIRASQGRKMRNARSAPVRPPAPAQPLVYLRAAS